MQFDISKFTSCNPLTSLIEEICLTDLKDHQILPSLADIVLDDKLHQSFDIKSFIIKHSQLNENEYEALYKILEHCDHLTNINLSENHMDVDHAERILNLLKNVKLKSFIFTDNWIGEKEAIRIISALETQKDLVTIDLSLDWLRDIGVTLLVNALKENTSLVNLNVSCNDFHTKGLSALVDYLKTQQHITSIDLSYNFLDESSASYIADLISSNKIIANLNLRANHIGNAGAEMIAQALTKNIGLVSFDLSDNKIGSEGIKKLIYSIEKHKKLSRFNLSHNKIDTCEAEEILKITANTVKKIEIVI